MPRLADSWLRTILLAFYQNRTLTRYDLHKATGLNPASTSHAIRHLIDRGIVIKTGEVQSEGGRHQDVLDLNPEAGYFLAVDLEGTSVRFALTNLVGDIRFGPGKYIESGPQLQFEELLTEIHALLEQMNALQRPRVLACGVSYPGMMDDQERITAVNLGWSEFPLGKRFRAALDIPVFLENAHRTCILAEHWLGAARGSRNCIYLIVGRGVGIGAFIDGHLLEGQSGIAGELGHITIDPDADDMCLCGKTGCLEAIASFPSIARQYFSRAGSTHHGTKHQAIEVFERARQGDQIAIEVLERVSRSLGRALAHLILLLNPEMVILGGDILSAIDLMLGDICTEMKRHTLSRFLDGLQVVPSALGSDIGLKGAAALAFRESLQESTSLRKLVSSPKRGQTRSKTAAAVSVRT